MVNQQLLSYIKQQLAAGVPKPDLQKAIAAAGWAPVDIADTFAAAEGRPVVPPAPLQPPPMQAAVTTPVTARPAVVSMPRRRVWPWVLIVIAVLLLAVGGVVYAMPESLRSFILSTLPFVSQPTPEPVVEQVPYTPPVVEAPATTTPAGQATSTGSTSLPHTATTTP